MPAPSFATLLYRYFFFAWLFKDVRSGDRFQRAAAWQHNVQQARWLPLYLRRWFAVGVILYLMGLACETQLQAPLLSAFFFVPVAATLSLNAVIGVLILGFRFFPAPH